ncbi:MAG TPA: SulP family inorganic anion transporter [Trebonia sp.]
MPGLGVIASYRREWLARDIIAGVVLTTLLIPQGMAYAELAGLPPITGLYTSIMCLLAYAVFGPSRILVLGPDSSCPSSASSAGPGGPATPHSAAPRASRATTTCTLILTRGSYPAW